MNYDYILKDDKCVVVVRNDAAEVFKNLRILCRKLVWLSLEIFAYQNWPMRIHVTLEAHEIWILAYDQTSVQNLDSLAGGSLAVARRVAAALRESAFAMRETGGRMWW